MSTTVSPADDPSAKLAALHDGLVELVQTVGLHHLRQALAEAHRPRRDEGVAPIPVPAAAPAKPNTSHDKRRAKAGRKRRRKYLKAEVIAQPERQPPCWWIRSMSDAG